MSGVEKASPVTLLSNYIMSGGGPVTTAGLSATTKQASNFLTANNGTSATVAATTTTTNSIKSSSGQIPILASSYVIPTPAPAVPPPPAPSAVNSAIMTMMNVVPPGPHQQPLHLSSGPIAVSPAKYTPSLQAKASELFYRWFSEQSRTDNVLELIKIVKTLTAGNKAPKFEDLQTYKREILSNITSSNYSVSANTTGNSSKSLLRHSNTNINASASSASTLLLLNNSNDFSTSSASSATSMHPSVAQQHQLQPHPPNQHPHHHHHHHHHRPKSPPSLHSPPMSPISRMPNSPKSPRQRQQLMFLQQTGGASATQQGSNNSSVTSINIRNSAFINEPTVPFNKDQQQQQQQQQLTPGDKSRATTPAATTTTTTTSTTTTPTASSKTPSLANNKQQPKPNEKEIQIQRVSTTSTSSDFQTPSSTAQTKTTTTTPSKTTDTAKTTPGLSPPDLGLLGSKKQAQPAPQTVVSASPKASTINATRRSLHQPHSLSHKIPQFHFPHGRPDDKLFKTLEDADVAKLVQAEFRSRASKDAGTAASGTTTSTTPSGNKVQREDFGDLCKIVGLPRYWKVLLYRACLNASPNAKVTTVTQAMFEQTWNKYTSGCYDYAALFVKLITNNRPGGGIVYEDWEPLMQDIVDSHPGLKFLHDHKEFHSRYIKTVIARIYYTVNRSWSGKITLTELRRSNFLSVLESLEFEEDINLIKDYFSYEHFYVIYCKFWELDKDHDLFISKEDLYRHNNFAISPRVIDRIFSGSVIRSKEWQDGLMSYYDFVWFLISEEDKRNPTSIEYWFRILDIDGDGMLSMYELEYFYNEQVEQMRERQIEYMPFTDLICQILDLVKPAEPGKIRLRDLKNCKMTHVFFDTFINLEKYLEFEQRDPFANARDADSQELSDWQKYASEEYENLVSEDVNADNQDGYANYDDDFEDEPLMFNNGLNANSINNNGPIQTAATAGIGGVVATTMNNNGTSNGMKLNSPFPLHGESMVTVGTGESLLSINGNGSNNGSNGQLNSNNSWLGSNGGGNTGDLRSNGRLLLGGSNGSSNTVGVMSPPANTSAFVTSSHRSSYD